MTPFSSSVDSAATRDLLFDSMGTGVLAMGSDGRIEFLNRVGAELMGVSQGDVLGRRSEDVSAEAFGPVLPLLLAASETTVRSGDEFRRQLLAVETDDGERNYGYSVSPILPTKGESDADERRGGGAVLVFTELTAVRRRERTLTEQEYSASLARVSAWMAHEVKNPLATIKMYANLIERADPQEVADSVRVIRDQVEVAQSRISDILRAVSFSPADTTGLTVCAFDEVVQEYIQREGQGLPHVTIETDIDDEEYLVPLSEQDATSLVSHLVTNSSEALEGPGEVSIRLGREDGAMTLVVSDTGPGFPDEDLARLFQPFFTSKTRGTGLGLWTVRRIVESRRGWVRLANTDSGGAEVTIRLPVLDRSTLDGKRILVVDDEDSLRRLILRQLRDVIAHADEAATGTAALEMLESNRYDLLITDVRLPGIDGAELVRRVGPMMPVLVISGNVGLESEFSELRRQGLAFLSKPFDARELTLALSYLLWEVGS